MLRFKQFLRESVVDQVGTTRRRADLLTKNMNTSLDTGDVAGSAMIDGVKTNMYINSSKSPESWDDQKNFSRAGSYYHDPGQEFYDSPESMRAGRPSRKSEPSHGIDMYTDSPMDLRDITSPEHSTLRHELQHLNQKNLQLQNNHHRSGTSTKFDNIRGINPKWQDFVDRSGVGQRLSYQLDPQEVNARGIQRAGDAMIHQDRLSRTAVTSNPDIADFEFNLEKSRGTASPPTLDPNTSRNQANVAFDTQMAKENQILDPQQHWSGKFRNSDVREINKDITTARKSVKSDIARGLQANTPNAQTIAQDAYSDKVVGPQRERQQRVATTQSEVEGIKAKYGGFQTSPFLSDPLSTSNMAADMAGALGDVHSKAQTMTKAQSSLYNPMFSDSEQMMGDAFLRGGGEEYQVDPRFLQMQRQREKDREKEKQN